LVAGLTGSVAASAQTAASPPASAPGVTSEVTPIVAPIAGSPAAAAASAPVLPLAAPAPADAPKSYAIPAAEIIGFDFLLNRYNHLTSGVTDYDVSWGSIKRNLRGPWVTDNDPFNVNQFAHPYQGSLYHGASRSAGLSYWESAAMTFAGSAGCGRMSTAATSGVAAARRTDHRRAMARRYQTFSLRSASCRTRSHPPS
jgi:hypothetical protein